MNLWNRILRRMNQKNMPLPLGRWKLETCNQKTNQKIDSSNEDHCGTCAGELSMPKVPTKLDNPTFHLDSVYPVTLRKKTDNPTKGATPVRV